MSFSIRRYIIYVDTHFFFYVYFIWTLIYFLQFLFLLFSTLSLCFCFVLVPTGKQGWCEHQGFVWIDRLDKRSTEWSYSHLWVAIGTCLHQSKSECCYCCISIWIDICGYMLVYMDIHLCVEKCTMDCFICLLICFSQEHQCIHLNVWICIYLYAHTKLNVSYLDGLSFHCIGVFVWVHWLFTLFSITWLYDCIYVFM